MAEGVLKSLIASFPSSCFSCFFLSIFAATARRASALCAPCFRRIYAFVPHVICWKQRPFSGRGSCACEWRIFVSICCCVTSPRIPAGRRKTWWTLFSVTKALKKRKTPTQPAFTHVPCTLQPRLPHSLPRSCPLSLPLRRNRSAGVIALITTRSEPGFKHLGKWHSV